MEQQTAKYLDECGLPMLVEGVPRNQLRSEGQMKKESVLSIAQSARRTGSCMVVLGPENTQILCEVCVQKPSGLRWFADGFEVPCSKISYLLDVVQGQGNDHDRPAF